MRKPEPDTSPTPPRAGEGKRGEEGYLGYLLRQAAAAQRLRMERALAELEVTPPQFATLTMLAAYSGLSNAELARLALQTPQTLSAIVANLARRGLISRRPHAVHGRIQHIDVTPEGRALLARCRERVLRLEGELLRGVDADEERAVRRWLVRLAVEQADEPGEG